MRLDLTNRECKILTDALAQPAGVCKCDLKDAERLREHLRFRLHGPVPQPVKMSPIRSHWPDNHITPDKHKHWSFDKPKKEKVEVNNLNGQREKTTVDNVLDGLL